MDPIKGYCCSSIDGGLVACVPVTDKVPGFIYIQADTFADLAGVLRRAMDCHYRDWKYHANWALVGFSPAQVDPLVTRIGFRDGLKNLLGKTTKDKPYHSSNCMSYQIDGTRFTLLDIDSHKYKPELVSLLYRDTLTLLKKRTAWDNEMAMEIGNCFSGSEG